MEEKFINFLKRTELYNEKFNDYINDKIEIKDLSETPKDLRLEILKMGSNVSKLEELGDYVHSIYFLGTTVEVDDDDIIKNVYITVPKMTNDITVGMNIREYVHALMLYRELGKEYKEDKYEDIIPTYYELAYLKENNQEDYFNLYLESIKEDNSYLSVLLNIFDKDNKINTK